MPPESAGDEDKTFPEPTDKQLRDAARRERIALDRASKELDRIPEVMRKLDAWLDADEAARRIRNNT